MNRKLLAFLLLLPLLMFAVDQAFGSGETGSKKSKTTTKQETAETTDIAQPLRIDVPTDQDTLQEEIAAEKISSEIAPEKGSKTARKQMKEHAKTEQANRVKKQEGKHLKAIKDLKKLSPRDRAAVNHLRTQYKDKDEEGMTPAEVAFWEEDEERLNYYRLEEALSDFLKKNVLEVAQEMDAAHYSAEKVMSRCPSGYRVFVYADGEQPRNEGMLLFDEGCMETPVGKFRYELATQTVQFFVSEKFGYVSAEKYLELYEIAVS